ncbi:MAG TPA: TonB-dependent receptor [Flavisolibacter sp.]|nr:TonB-dependent receptor [Flavisolibacter sp.]
MKKHVWLLSLMLLGALFSWAQREVTGQVVDNDNQSPLQGANVTVKGTRSGTTTDISGRFRITVPAGSQTLVISSSGFVTREVNLSADQTSYDITLARNVAALDEVVVVVAYGTQEKKKVTGSVGKVSARELENVPLPSVDQILQGKVAGLQSVASSGQPGAAQDIRIRGIGSISASSSPLFVIDGIPVNTGDASSLTNSSNLLASLNPNDIESISVLKDASASSIYGSRAANGVIIINTKKGRAGKTRVRLDAEFGTNDIANRPDAGKPLNKEELFDLYSDGLVNAGFDPADVGPILNDAFGFDKPANYDWLDLVTRRGSQQQLNLSVSGGDPKTQFFLSGGYFKQQSPVLGSDLKRYSSTMNLRHQLNQKISVGINLNLSSFRQTGATEAANFRNPILAALGLLPTQEAFNADGSPNFDPNIFTQIYNPLAIIQYDKQSNQTSKLLGSGTVEYRPISNLKLTSRFGVDYNNIEEYTFYNPTFGDAASTQGFSGNAYTRLYNWVWTNFVDYTFKGLQNRLDGSVTVGYEAQQSRTYTQSGQGNVLPKNSSIVYPVPAVPTIASVVGSDYSFNSIFSRAQLNFLGKYSLSGSVRRDGSSRFGADNRFGTFWSVGAAWNIDQEDFMKNSNVFSSLKLRSSYGVNGNAGIGNYNWRSVFLFNSTYNGAPASYQNSIGNNNLTWEQNKPFDIGLEIGVLKSRLSLEADYYIRKTDNLLLNEPLSGTGGFTTYSNNVGAMENKGVELTLNANPVKTKDFNWTISINSAWNKNRVTRLREGVDEVIGNPFTLKVGEDVQSYYLRQWAGADPANGDPLWYVDESKGATTNEFSQAKRSIVGSASPKGFGGFSTSLTYKFITLDAQLNYQYGNYIFNQWDFIFISDGAFLGLNHNRRELERWRKPGDITDVPAYVNGNGTNSNDNSTRYLYKGDYIRLRNVSVGVDIPKSVTQRLNIESARFYVRGTNLWTKTFDDHLTADPEQPVGGQTNLQFFNPKSFTVGINLQF